MVAMFSEALSCGRIRNALSASVVVTAMFWSEMMATNRLAQGPVVGTEAKALCTI